MLHPVRFLCRRLQNQVKDCRSRGQKGAFHMAILEAKRRALVWALAFPGWALASGMAQARLDRSTKALETGY